MRCLLNVGRYVLQYQAKYQKTFEVITGKVLLNISFQGTSNSSTASLVPIKDQGPVSSGVITTGESKNVLVTVVRAENLLAKDRGGTSDPFTVLILGRQIKKTSIIDKTLNPEWNETFEFETTPLESNLNVVLYDYDKGILYGNSQEYLGSVTVPILELLGRGNGEEW